MRTILVSTSSRAERGLLRPVIIELEAYAKAHPDDGILIHTFEFDYRKFVNDNIITAFDAMLKILTPDIVLVPCDRWEQTLIASYAFNHGFFVAHFHAGDLGENTTDDINRYAISLFSHILFCNSHESKDNLVKYGFNPKRIHVVGTTALDHVDIEQPPDDVDEPFDLVVLHPDPMSAKATSDDLKETIIQILRSPAPIIVWMQPNHDQNHEIISDFLEKESTKLGRHIIVYDNLPRGQFLGLLATCTRAIGNSSAFTYELPLLERASNDELEIIHIGHRNQHRTKPNASTGASKLIAETLCTMNVLSRRKELPCLQESKTYEYRSTFPGTNPPS